MKPLKMLSADKANGVSNPAIKSTSEGFSALKVHPTEEHAVSMVFDFSQVDRCVPLLTLSGTIRVSSGVLNVFLLLDKKQTCQTCFTALIKKMQ